MGYEVRDVNGGRRPKADQKIRKCGLTPSRSIAGPSPVEGEKCLCRVGHWIVLRVAGGYDAASSEFGSLRLPAWIMLALCTHPMETSLRIKVSELDMRLIERIKALFGKDREITLTIQAATDFGLTRTESKKEYLARLEKAIANLEKGNTVELNEAQLDEMVLQRLKR
jgi:hypothetical protein